MRANKRTLCIMLFVNIANIVCIATPMHSYAQSMEARPPQAPTPGAAAADASPAYDTDTATSTPLPAPAAAAPGTSTASPSPGGAGSAPLPGTSDTAGGPPRLTSVISLHDAQAWVDRFKNQTVTASPQALDQIATFYEWLLELLDEHNRLATIFTKSESTRSMADTERQTVTKFSHLKIEVLLLKAELLIKLNRYAEAIVPLVDIINSEPLSAAGKEAYKDLQDIGFSEIPAFTSQFPDSSQTPLTSNPYLSSSAHAKTTPVKAAPKSTTAKARRTRYTVYRFH